MELKKYFLTDQNRIGFTKNRVVDNGFAFVFSTETGKIAFLLQTIKGVAAL